MFASGDGIKTQANVDFYIATTSDNELHTITKERVFWFSIKELNANLHILDNLRWLIPMALNGNEGPFGNMWPFIIREGS